MNRKPTLDKRPRAPSQRNRPLAPLGIRFDPAAPNGFGVNSVAGDDETECRTYVKSKLPTGTLVENWLANSNGLERLKGST
jgi:hypothetical protein